MQLGIATVVRKQVRSYGWENLVATWFADFRYAARRLHGNLVVTTVAAITLALGIGAARRSSAL
jgi:hypothetical protein